MNTNMTELAAALEKNPGATEFQIAQIESQLGFSFPPDYREFIRQSNGAEGKVGPVSYLMLWAIEQIPKLNAIVREAELLPGFVLFGTSGGGMCYAFDIRQPNNIQIAQVPDIPMSLDWVETIGSTFGEFLQYLYNQS